MAYPLTHEDPETLGDYRLVARLGSGGMGVVYLGRSPRGRSVALKTMHARIAADTTFRTRFRLEADAARVIGGRYGAEVVDADPIAEIPWLATEFVLGPPLDDAVALCGPLPEQCVRALGAMLCEALGQLHGSDVLHRDLKPSNILLSAFGPKVIDFGIARAVGDDRLTSTGAAAGTPAFMSPEQATGQEHTAAGDVFALAGVLIFAATGHGPFGSGQPADLLYRVRYGEPDLSGVPAGLIPALEQCLSKDPLERPGTAELASELGAHRGDFADHLPSGVLADIARRCADVWEPAPQRLPAPGDEAEEAVSAAFSSGIPRRKVLAASGGGALALAAVGFGAWNLASHDGSDSEDKSGPATSARPANVPPELSWKRDTAEISSLSTPLTVKSMLAVFTEDGLVGLNAENGKPLWTMTEDVYSYTVTTDGERLWAMPDLTAGGLEIAEVDLETGGFKASAVRSAEFEGSASSLLTAADGSIYAVTRDPEVSNVENGYRLVRFDLRSGEVKWQQKIGSSPQSDGPEALIATVAGRYLLLAKRNEMAVRDARTGEELWKRTLPAGSQAADSRLAPRRIAATDTHAFVGFGEVWAVRLRDGRKSWTFGAKRDMGKDFVKGNRRYGPPTVKDGVVYVAEGERGFVALDAGTGEISWEEKNASLVPEFESPPVVGKKYVYGTVDERRWLKAVDLSTHTTAWPVNGPRGGGILRSAVVHTDAGKVIVASGNTVAAVPLE